MTQLQFLISAVLLARSLAASPDICSTSHLEQCSNSLYLLVKEGHRSVVPVGEDATLDHCEKQKQAEKCVRERTDACDTGLTKGFIRILLDENHEEFSNRCDPTSKEYKRYLSIAPCLNSLGNELYNCSANLIVQLVSIPNAKSFREKSERACCIFSSFEKCALELVGDGCGSEARAFVDDYIGRTVRETATLLCSTDPSVCASQTPVEIDDNFDIDRDGPQTLFQALHVIIAETQKRP